MATRPTTRRPYGLLARYYDLFFLEHRAAVDAAREHVLGTVMSGVRSACDLACGTGTTAVSLAQRGIQTFAVDVSPAMCRLTREKARAAGVKVEVLRSDMRELRLPEAVDLVVCEGDALNHLPRKADLGAVTTSVARALRPGGRFYFDVNNRLGFESYWSGNVWIEKPGVVVVMRLGHAAGKDQAWSDIEWFLREGRTWRRRRERVEEVCWSGDEIHAALEEAGLTEVQEWDACPFFGEGSPVRPGCRTLFLARKPAGPR